MGSRSHRLLAVAAGVGLHAAGCVSAPYTHRSQFMIVPESQELTLGADAYHEVLAKEPIVTDPKINAVVREVGERIARAADKPSYKWEFKVIDDDSMVNAFALPGGKVAVYTGLFPVAQDSAGLAAVLGHEVGHALARHGAERISQNLALQVGAVGLSVALGAQTAAGRDAVMQAFGLGAQLGVLLPYGRAQESEADHIGLILMAKAGYDPHAALELWQRFEKTGDKSPPEFLSTHPTYGTRQHNIQSWLPEAMRYYQADPTLTVTALPSDAELEAAGGSPDAAFKRYARSFNDKASDRSGTQIMIEAMATVYEVSADELTRRLKGPDLSFGEVAVASAIAKAGAGSFDQVAAGHKPGEGWATRDATIAKQALTLLREVQIEARRLAGKSGQR